VVISPSIHYLTPPVLYFPAGGELQSGEVNILWNPSVDTWGYSVTYKISYSIDEGTNWITLMTNLTATTFIWDTSTVLDGSNYLLKVEVVSMGGINASFISTSTLTIDNTPPMVSIVSPLEQTYTTDMITVTLSGDADNYWYYIESADSQNQTWTTSINRTLTDGTYTIHVYGNDSVGNIAHVFVTFTISNINTTTTTSTPSWSTLLLLFALFAMLSWKQRKKKS